MRGQRREEGAGTVDSVILGEQLTDDLASNKTSTTCDCYNFLCHGMGGTMSVTQQFPFGETILLVVSAE